MSFSLVVLELGAPACISTCIFAYNPLCFALLATTFALASPLPFKTESIDSASLLLTTYTASIEDHFALASLGATF
jgi:hypothetical protein